jgi:hypothetical protein
VEREIVQGTNAGTSYSQLITDQLSEERSRKSTLEARGITVITTSGGLATLIFALTAGVTARTGFKFPGSVRVPLMVTLIAFVGAAICGLITNVPMRFKEPTSRALAALVDVRYWSASGDIGQLRVAEAQVKILTASRAANRLKVNLLLTAMVFELVAIVSLSLAVADIIYKI